ncbi:1310_t:CDS:2 [Funneliformis geosporum]|uniref:1310_t:CDS:1 n=1 Tax=Funneliformis geosporum TaxID=1117311 RepID=A0A9W4SAR5_9GLOM|nr:1310_t:CDS:2 [Funneliformis geosporum]
MSIKIGLVVKGASQGLGLGNEFLSHIREVDLICHVLRCFPKKEIVHVEKSVDPLRDFEIIQLELILADLQQIKKRLGKIKLKDEKTKKEQEILQLIQKELENGKAINQLSLTEEEKEIIKPHNFLTKKPFFLLANYSGEESEIQKLETYAHQKELDLFPLAIKLEGEVEELTTAEKEEIVGKDEVKSWLAEQKMEARACAGLIHSDIQKNFISVEVYNYTD